MVIKPRVVPVFVCAEPVVVFTDGACEPNGAVIGSVLFVRSSAPQYFGLKAPPHVADSWRSGRSYQNVGQAELIRVLDARFA